MQACLRFLAELRACWNGRMFFPPARSLAARAQEARLEVIARCELLMVCGESVELILLAGSQIGPGRSDVRQNWFVEETDAGLELTLHDGDRTTYRFQPAGEGRWRGERLAFPPCEAILWERGAGQATQDAAPAVGGLLEALVDASGLHAAGGAEHAEDLVAALRLLRRAEPATVTSLELWAAGADPRAEVARRVLADREFEELRPFDRSAILPVMESNYIRPSGPR
jgi:hypothetical protein